MSAGDFEVGRGVEGDDACIPVVAFFVMVKSSASSPMRLQVMFCISSSRAVKVATPGVVERIVGGLREVGVVGRSGDIGRLVLVGDRDGDLELPGTFAGEAVSLALTTIS